MHAQPKAILGERVSFRPSEAPEVIGVSRATVYRWAKQGHIKIYTVAGISLILVEDYKNYIRSLGG